MVNLWNSISQISFLWSLKIIKAIRFNGSIYCRSSARYWVYLLVGGLDMAFIFPYLGNFIIPTGFHIFPRSCFTTKQFIFSEGLSLRNMVHISYIAMTMSGDVILSNWMTLRKKHHWLNHWPTSKNPVSQLTTMVYCPAPFSPWLRMERPELVSQDLFVLPLKKMIPRKSEPHLKV